MGHMEAQAGVIKTLAPLHTNTHNKRTNSLTENFFGYIIYIN